MMTDKDPNKVNKQKKSDVAPIINEKYLMYS